MGRDMSQNTSIDIIMQDPKFVELSLKVMTMEQDIDEDYLIPFQPDDVDEDGKQIVYTRQGDYGNDLSYVPVKYIRQRADAAFNKKWSFFIIAEKREGEPFDKWSKKDNDYINGDNYIKCIGMMIVPGFGIRMEYGVKKVFGGGESSDWKACKTDAFKKCCEAFGIYLDYDIEDDGGSNSGSNTNKRDKKPKKVDYSDIEYSDEELDAALEHVVDFGKYDGYTLEDIATSDLSYIEWLSNNANDEDMRDYCLIIMAYYNEMEEEKNARRAKRNNGIKNERSNNSRNKSDEKSTKRKNLSSKPNKKIEKRGDDKKRQLLIELCEESFEDVDDVQMKAIISSVSTSNKYPRGKTDIDTLTLSELEELADVLDIDLDE